MSFMPAKSDARLIDINLKIGGIAPSVIHELSGVYSNFSKAFKELLSNSYDADSTRVIIEFADDFEWVTIEDNGVGMTPFEFQNDYLRIGTSPEKQNDVLTIGGRRKIGRKGIGFLALVRYCERAEIYTHSDKIIHLSNSYLLSEKKIDNRDRCEISLFNGEFNASMIPLYRIDSVVLNNVELDKELYKIDKDKLIITNIKNVIENKNGSIYQSRILNDLKQFNMELFIKYSLDCNEIDLFATIDYQYLLNTKNKDNIVNLVDFSKIRLISSSNSRNPHYTKIELYLHEFIRNELIAPKRLGRVRNIASSSGLEKFLWNLSRNTPVGYDVSNETLFDLEMSSLIQDEPLPFTVSVINRKLNVQTEIKRPFIGEIQKQLKDSPIVCKPVVSNTDGLIVKGYLLGFKTPIFPGEMRGISIRVRGVEIGSPGYLDIEKQLPLKFRAMLDHVMGEINVSDGLDAIHTIMAGREGFYIEDKKYQLLRKLLIGNSETNFGLLGRVIRQVIEYESLESSALRIVHEARQRRDAYLFISYALNNLIVGSNYGRSLRKLFSQQDILANHLIQLPDFEIQLGETSGIYKVILSETLSQDFMVDFINKEILLSKDSDYWKTTVFILGRNFLILLKNGKADDPLCELDFRNNKIYINWLHPTRAKLGDANFIKTALAWRIAYLAANGDVDIMMNLALRLLSFSQQ
jgi:hypothetical protein